MSNLENTASTVGQIATPLAQSDAMNTMAMVGKTSAALALVVAAIWLCSYLLKRFQPGSTAGKNKLNIISSTAIGQRERVVIVEIDNTWLVLGVGGGQITRLHSQEAPASAAPSNFKKTLGESFSLDRNS